ncbi:MAG: hypothetical protein Q7R82_01305 [Candidatus Daviesbacteria bacterium]|nr:hypothetical protein [Candidatus Daviesbacteria bacterium]
MSYESEIKFIEGGEVIVMTKGNHQEAGGYIEETKRWYPSTTKLRESLVREKLRAQLLVYGSNALYVGGGGQSLIALLDIYTQNQLTRSEVTQFGVGVVLAVIGNRLLKYGEEKVEKVDSRIKSFNTTFKDTNLKPIPLGFRDYLTTSRIPFFHR